MHGGIHPTISRLARRRPPGSAPRYTVKNLEQIRERNLLALEEMIDLGMQLARAAAAELLDPPPSDEPAVAAPPKSSRPEPPRIASPRFDPHLAFARATRAVRQAMALELRIAEGTLVPVTVIPGPPHPSRAPIRTALHAAIARAEPDRAIRTRRFREADERLDADLRESPAGDIKDSLERVAAQLGIVLDYGKLPDELLGIPRRPPGPATDPTDPAYLFRR